MKSEKKTCEFFKFKTNLSTMKVILFVGVLCVVHPFYGVGSEDVFAVPSKMLDKVLQEMPLKSMDFYSDRFYPETIKTINSKHNIQKINYLHNLVIISY